MRISASAPRVSWCSSVQAAPALGRVHLPQVGEHVGDQGGGEEGLGDGVVQLARQAGALGGDGILGGFLLEQLVGLVQLLGALGDALFQNAAVLGFLSSQFFCGEFFLGDVFDHADRVERFAIRAAHRRKIDPPPKYAAILADVAFFHRVLVALPFDQLDEQLTVDRAVFLDGEHGWVELGDLFEAVTGQPRWPSG